MNVELNRYRDFLIKVDEKFSEIQVRQGFRMKCASGCQSCCVPDLTVFRIEKENISAHIRATPGLAERLDELERGDPHQGTRCRFLNQAGRCEVYDARPLVCRSHGAPLFSKAGAGTRPLLDACPLNFAELKNLAELPPQDFINLDTINAVLAALNQEIDISGQRFALNVDAILDR